MKIGDVGFEEMGSIGKILLFLNRYEESRLKEESKHTTAMKNLTLKSCRNPFLQTLLTIFRFLKVEMMPLQLWETTLDPGRRLLKQLTIEDAAEANYVFSSLMGAGVEYRKEMIHNCPKMIDLGQLDI